MFQIGESDIHGRGCIATEPIAAGRVIGRLTGEATTADGPHVIWTHDDSALRVTNGFRYLNHADDPNAEIDGESLEVRSARPIRPGEEITIHYGPEWA